MLVSATLMEFDIDKKDRVEYQQTHLLINSKHCNNEAGVFTLIVVVFCCEASLGLSLYSLTRKHAIHTLSTSPRHGSVRKAQKL